MANWRPIFTFTAQIKVEMQRQSWDLALPRRLLNLSTCTIFVGATSDVVMLT